MKKSGFFVHLGFAFLAFALLSCTEKGEPSSGVGRGMELTVSAAAQTKADDTSSDEEAVKSLQVFVFSDNKLEAVSYSDESDNVTLRCFEGSKNIYAVVNHSEIGWTPEMKEEELQGTVFELNGSDDLNTMVGIETGKFLAAGSDSSPVQLEIEVRRVAARIILRSVKNRSADSFLTIKRAYITNVSGDVSLSTLASIDSLTPQLWYNKRGLSENLGDLESIFCSEEMTVRVSPSHSFDKCFYCYPNLTENDNTFANWSSRFTRLVLSAQYNGNSCFYVVSIGGIQEDYSFIQSNHSYEVDLEITGFGSWDEEGVLVSEGDEDGGEGDGGDGDEDEDEDEDEGDDEKKHGPDGDDPFIPGGGGDEKRHSVSIGTGDERRVIRFKGGSAEVRKL